MKSINFEDLKLTPKEMKELAEGARRFVYFEEAGEPLTESLTTDVEDDTV